MSRRYSVVPPAGGVFAPTEERKQLLRKKLDSFEVELFRGLAPDKSLDERRRSTTESIKKILSRGPK